MEQITVRSNFTALESALSVLILPSLELFPRSNLNVV